MVRQAPHEQVWVEIVIHIHLPTQRVAEGGQARQSQLLSMDYLGMGDTVGMGFGAGSREGDPGR